MGGTPAIALWAEDDDGDVAIDWAHITGLDWAGMFERAHGPDGRGLDLAVNYEAGVAVMYGRRGFSQGFSWTTGGGVPSQVLGMVEQLAASGRDTGVVFAERAGELWPVAAGAGRAS